MYKINHMPSVIEIGHIGENRFRPIEIDMRAWLAVIPSGVASIIHIRPGETEADAYITGSEMSDGILRWTPAAGDLGNIEGYGQMQIWLQDIETHRGKSTEVQTFVRGTLVSESDVPAAQETWMEQMNTLKVETYQARQDAEAWAVGKRDGVDVTETDVTFENNAKYYAELTDETGQQMVEDLTEQGNEILAQAINARDRAEQAAQEKGYMDFFINDQGHLIYERTDNIDNIDFELDEGRLIALWPAITA